MADENNGEKLQEKKASNRIQIVLDCFNGAVGSVQFASFNQKHELVARTLR